MLYLTIIFSVCTPVNVPDISGNTAIPCFTCFCTCVSAGIVDFYASIKTQITNLNHLISYCYTLMINHNFDNATPCQVFKKNFFLPFLSVYNSPLGRLCCLFRLTMISPKRYLFPFAVANYIKNKFLIVCKGSVALPFESPAIESSELIFSLSGIYCDKL